MGCATLKNRGQLKIIGYDKKGYATRLPSSTTPKMKYGIPKFPRITSSPSPRDNSTDFNSTTANQSETQSANNAVITISIVVPVCFMILGGSLIFLQYRYGTGFRCGCIPYRRRMDKLKNSNEDVSNSNQMESEGSQAQCTSGTQTEQHEIENIGPAEPHYTEKEKEKNVFNFCKKRTLENIKKFKTPEVEIV